MEEEIGAELGGLVGGSQQDGVLVDVVYRAEGRRACAEEKEMPESIVVSDVVEGISIEAATLVPRERVQQWTSEQSEDFPQLPEEVVEAVTLVPCERVQQWSAEKFEDVPQHLTETVEVVKTALQERISARRTVEQCLDVPVEGETKMSFRHGFPRGFLLNRAGSSKYPRLQAKTSVCSV